MLPLYYNNNHKTGIRNCVATLNTELRKQNIHPVPIKDKNNPNSIRIYEKILRNWNKKQDIISSSQNNAGFKRFIDSLKVIDVARQ